MFLINCNNYRMKYPTSYQPPVEVMEINGDFPAAAALARTMGAAVLIDQGLETMRARASAGFCAK